MVFVLVLGDAHIPLRSHSIPPQFKRLLVPGKIQSVLCTGDCGDPIVFGSFLREIAADVTIVRGDFDTGPQGRPLPETKIVTVGEMKIGLIHGHQVVPWADKSALALLQRQLGTDILVHGHTHAFDAFEADGKFFINPGSVTGAYGSLSDKPVPSFVLMDVQGSRVTSYVYRLIGGSVKIEKIEYSRP
jgi:vacuolar protein sorting-associated protein 29